MERKISIYNNIDWLTVWLYLILITIGWLNIYAAVYDAETGFVLKLQNRYVMQFIWIAGAFTLIGIVSLLDTRFFMNMAIPAYLAVLGLLVFVLMFGDKVNGARSWIAIGSFRLQPAEFAKFTTAMALAKVMGAYNFKMSKWRNIAKIGAILFVPAALIVLQNDTGSALVYVAFVFVLYRQGLPGYILVLGILSAVTFFLSLVFELSAVFISLILLFYGVFFALRRSVPDLVKSILIPAAFLVLFLVLKQINIINFSLETQLIFSMLLAAPVFLVWAYRKKAAYAFALVFLVFFSFGLSYSVSYLFNSVLEPHQQKRINVLLGIEQDLRGAGYNVHQSMVAIGSGGASGKGFLNGTQTKFKFVPEQSTDFIFCTIGEEWGLIGTSITVSLFVLLLIRIILVAERQKLQFVRIYGYGVASLLFFHFIINIGMTIGLAPVVGIPLPFISYGGSSLFAFTILLFIFLRMDAERTALL